MTDSAQAGTQAANRIASDAQSSMEFTAIVTAIREVARIGGKQVWQIALDRTLFDERHCKGTLTATARSGRILSFEVVSIERDESREVWHTTYKPLQEGTEVTGILYPLPYASQNQHSVEKQ